MSIYARFFNHEIVATNITELVDFFQAIPDIVVTQELIDDLVAYFNSDMPYPKRYKIRPRVYFILIKTNAQTLEEFKANRRPGNEYKPQVEEYINSKGLKVTALSEINPGWYRGIITFKRVLLIPGTTKFQYQDTDFEAVVYCNNGQECYNRIVAHLQNRIDIDMRSQFPSAKGNSFDFEYLGEELPEWMQSSEESYDEDENLTGA